MKVAILILGAGASSRMGSIKQLLPYKHTTLLGWAIENAQNSTADQIFCVLGDNFERIKKEIEHYNITTVFNPNYQDGLSSTIIAGIQQLLDYDAVLVMLADQPKVDSAYLNALISGFKNHPNSVVASNYNGILGVPALFPKRYYSELLNLQGDKGAKQLLNSGSIPIKTINSSVNLLDIDTPEDYQKLNQ